MKECITIHVGQAGIQMGDAAWELLCLEHGVKQDGSVSMRGSESRCSLLSPSGSSSRFSDRTGNRSKSTRRLSEKPSLSTVTNSLMDSMGMCHPHLAVETNLGAFFEDMTKGKVTPRAVFIDTDGNSINDLRKRCRMLQPSRVVCGKYDAGGLFSKGYLNNETLVQAACTQISNMAAKCDNLSGFVVFRSTGGGTGSGLASSLMLSLVEEYGGKKSIVEISTGPTRLADEMLRPSVTEPYNAILATHASMYSSECSVIMDNNSIYDLCKSKLRVLSPTYLNMNRLIGQVVSSLTSSSRYQDDTSVHHEDLQRHLIPLPRLKFLMASLAPLGLKSTVERSGPVNVTLLTKEAMDPSNHLMTFNPHFGNYLGCGLLYRGEVHQNNVTEAIHKVMRLGRFNNRCEPDFVVGITSHPAPLVPFGDIGRCPRSVVLLSNTSSMKQSWMSVLSDFDLMFKHRAYCHWYHEDGLEFQDFVEAREDIVNLLHDYTEVDNIVTERITKMPNDPAKSNKKRG